MPELNLFRLLYGDRVESEELEQILLNYFGNARQVALSEFIYGREDQEGGSLKLVYEDNELSEIHPGPGCKGDSQLAELQKKIEDDLLSSVQRKVGKAVFFYSLPVTGAFRYRDIFQITPVLPDAPQPPQFLADHPLLIEYAFPATNNEMVNWARNHRRSKELELLLNVLLAFRINASSNSVAHSWVLDTLDAGQWKSALKQEGYVFASLSAKADDFSPLESFPSLQMMEDENYFGQVGISVGQQMALPKRFPSLCDTFFSLEQKERDRFLRAAFWYHHSSKVASYSNSAAFTAMVSAIEALIPSATPSGRCAACNRNLGPGPTQLFSDFVESLIPDGQIAEASKKRFYAIRSKLSHGGSLLHRDRNGVSMSLAPEVTGDWSNLRSIQLIAKLVLLNWLVKQGIKAH